MLTSHNGTKTNSITATNTQNPDKDSSELPYTSCSNWTPEPIARTVAWTMLTMSAIAGPRTNRRAMSAGSSGAGRTEGIREPVAGRTGGCEGGLGDAETAGARRGG